jgi:geranylgeranylglycerol-phosphate geranylgeranyltransferase
LSGTSNQMYGILLLTRPFGSVVLGGAVLSGILASGGSGTLSGYLMGFSLGFLLSAGAKCLNDYFDRNIDVINVPSRPIPSGTVTPTHALTAGVVLTGLGLLLSALMNWTVLLTVLVSIGLMLYYNCNLIGKRRGFLGNLVVSLCVTLSVVTGGAITGSFQGPLIFLSLMVFLTVVGLEVTKGIPDVEGDRKENVRTLAVIHGPRVAARIAVVFFLASVAIRLAGIVYLVLAPGRISASIWGSQIYGGLSFGFVVGLLSALGLLYSSVILLRNPSPRTAWRVNNYVLAWAALGITAFSIGKLM